MRIRKRETTAYHETGHAFAAWSYGVRVHRVSLVRGHGYAGVMEHKNPIYRVRLGPNSSGHGKAKAEQLITICLAGPIAQRVFAPRSLRSWHGSEDWMEATELAEKLHPSQEAASAYLRYVRVLTTDVIRSNWKRVSLIADALLTKGELSNGEITPLLCGSEIQVHRSGMMTLTHPESKNPVRKKEA
jgi:hypothetical protein